MPVIMNMLPNQRFNQGNLFAYGSSCSSSTTSSVDNLPDYFIPPPRYLVVTLMIFRYFHFK